MDYFPLQGEVGHIDIHPVVNSLLHRHQVMVPDSNQFLVRIFYSDDSDQEYSHALATVAQHIAQDRHSRFYTSLANGHSPTPQTRAGIQIAEALAPHLNALEGVITSFVYGSVAYGEAGKFPHAFETRRTRHGIYYESSFRALEPSLDKSDVDIAIICQDPEQIHAPLNEVARKASLLNSDVFVSLLLFPYKHVLHSISQNRGADFYRNVLGFHNKIILQGESAISKIVREVRTVHLKDPQRLEVDMNYEFDCRIHKAMGRLLHDYQLMGVHIPQDELLALMPFRVAQILDHERRIPREVLKIKHPPRNLFYEVVEDG